jgi:hypothetical protein
MRRLLLTGALAVLAGAACDGTGPGGGRFVAERVAARTTTLVRGPARATFCPDDSVLLIIALGRTWSGGFALRSAFPLIAARDFRVAPSLGGPGSATAAFRSLLAGRAELGVAGSIRLEPSRNVSGRFDVQARDSAGVQVRIQGELAGIPLSVLPKGSCAQS